MHYHEFRKRNVGVLIPTYNNDRTLGKVIGDVLQYTDRIIVVNDGSTDRTAEVLSRFPQVSVVTYPRNKGKGIALRQGFDKAKELGYDSVISIDSDGQHFADDLPVFLDAIARYPDALLVGQRNMAQENVPGKSVFGQKFSNFWYEFETGIRLNDTQSGYRLYPVSAMKDLKFFTRKFEFEIEVLVRAAWAGIRVVEVPVKVFYPGRNERISHFRPFRDFARISLLNTVLVAITLLYIRPKRFVMSFRGKNFWRELKLKLFKPTETDTVKAVSVAFGVFMGIVPIWGFQLLTAIALSVVFRLNKALVIIAANISIPPMIPIIVFLSHWAGGVWLGDHAVSLSFDRELSLDTVKDSLVQYILGAITLAVASGIFFGFLTFAMLKLTRHQTAVG